MYGFAMLGSVALFCWALFAWRLHPVIGWTGAVAILVLFLYLGVRFEPGPQFHDVSLDDVEIRLRELEAFVRKMKR